ncbi:MAG: branched-chain amino acid ABC transporter substrate-binding protein [Anaerolineaceae bacterium]|nr:branched-chain amino acid ABC transporter substrate-binding protein [Anaerolineaceae bacterium]
MAKFFRKANPSISQGKLAAEWLVALAVLGLGLCLSACRTNSLTCDDPLGCVVVRPNNPVRIGVLLPLSGETAGWGQELSRGIEQAIMDRNGELLGHDIELIPLDSACDPAVGEQIVEAVDGDETLLGIIGPACSDVAQAVLPVVRRNNWVLISPATTAPFLTDNQPNLAFFRTVPNHLQQATAAANFAYEQLGVRQTAVFQDNTEYNNLLAQQFSDTFTQLGGTVSYQASLAAGQTELAGVLAEAASNAPQLIYLALFEPEATLLASLLAESTTLNRATLLGSDSLFSASFAGKLGNTNLLVTSPVFTGDAYDAFVALWTIRYETPPSSPGPVYAYDAALLLLDAIKAVAEVGQTGALVVGRSALRQELASGETVEGLSGALRCSPTGECAVASYGVYELDTAVRTNAAWPPPLVWQFE